MIRIFCFFLITFSVTAQISFSDKATDLGLGTTCGTTSLGNGVTFYDFDNDGWDDITLTTEDGQNLRFFKNNNGSFVEQTLSIPSISYQTKQVNWVDFDNDGDNDLFVTSNTDGNRLFENTGNLVFNDITVASGISMANMSSYGSTWGDYNNDGFLDVFVSNRTASPGNKLYRNNGDGTFLDVSLQAGIDPIGHDSFCAAFIDFNNDNLQDIYISNDKVNNSNILYKNLGNGTFEDVSVSSGTNISIDAMTVTVGDFNNDSWQDIYVTNSPNGNVLFQNNGDETFTDVSSSSGTIFNSVGWGACFLDVDNDKDIDLYVSGEFGFPITNYLNAAFYENNNDETFSLGNSSFPGDTRASFSNAIGDVDNDGYPEIIVSNNNGENVFLWKNNTTSTNNWLKIKTEGVISNKDGIGTRIEVSINGDKQYRYVHCGEGYLSQNSGTEIIGLGSNTMVDYIKLNWLSGTEDIFYNVTSNQVLNIVEGSSNVLSVNETLLNDYNIWPNPARNNLVINAKEQIDSYEVYTILGKKIISSNISESNFKIDISQLSSGTYFLKFSMNKSIHTTKFIKL